MGVRVQVLDEKGLPVHCTVAAVRTSTQAILSLTPTDTEGVANITESGTWYPRPMVTPQYKSRIKMVILNDQNAPCFDYVVDSAGGGTHSTVRAMMADFLIAAATASNIRRNAWVCGDDTDTNIECGSANSNVATAQLGIWSAGTQRSNTTATAGARYSLTGTISSTNDGYFRTALFYSPQISFHGLRLATSSTSIVHGFVVTICGTGSSFYPRVDAYDCEFSIGVATNANGALLDVSPAAASTGGGCRIYDCSGAVGLVYRFEQGEAAGTLEIRDPRDLTIYQACTDNWTATLAVFIVKGGSLTTKNYLVRNERGSNANYHVQNVTARQDGTAVWFRFESGQVASGTRIFLEGLNYSQVGATLSAVTLDSPAFGSGHSYFIDSCNFSADSANPSAAVTVSGSNWSSGVLGVISGLNFAAPTSGGTPVVTAHNLLGSTVHTDTVTQTVSRGSIVYGNSTPAWDELVKGAAGSVLFGDGTDSGWTISPKLAGYLRVGSASAPTNVTAGDLTTIRAKIGTDGAMAGTSILDVRGDVYFSGHLGTGISFPDPEAFLTFAGVISSPGGNGYGIVGDITFDQAGSLLAGVFANVAYSGTGAHDDIYGVAAGVNHIGTGTVAEMSGLWALGGTSASAGALAFWAGVLLEPAVWSGSKPTNSHALYGANQGGTGVAVAYGLRILAQTGTAVRSFIADALVIGTDAAAKTKLDVTGHSADLAAGEHRWYNAGNTQYVGFKAGTLAGNQIWTLPTADGTIGQVIQTDGAGVLSWTSAAGAYTDEQAQDAVGGILVDSATIDFTYSDATPSITATVIQAGIDHGSIGGLTDDDHVGYFRLVGRAGGQTGYGGTASGDDLVLESTSHATKGHIQLERALRITAESTDTQLLFSKIGTGNQQVRFEFPDVTTEDIEWRVGRTTVTTGAVTLSLFLADGTNTPIFRASKSGAGVVSMFTTGYARIGSGTAPTNVTAGDLTATRIVVPNATILHSAVSQLGGPVVIPTGGQLRLSDDDNSNYFGLKAPAVAQSENWVLHFPADDPAAGEWLKVTSAASPNIVSEWAAIAHGDVSTTSMKQTLLLVGWQPTTTSGCASPAKSEVGSTTKHDFTTLAFDPTTAESAFLHHPMPDNWDGGTVTFRVWWFGKTGYVVTSSDGVAWTLKATSYGDGEVIDAVFGTGITITDVGTANNELRKTADSAALTISGAGAGEMIHWVLTRTVSDGVDDWAADLQLVAVVVEYGISALSS